MSEMRSGRERASKMRLLASTLGFFVLCSAACSGLGERDDPQVIQLLADGVGDLRWSELRIEGLPYAPFDPRVRPELDKPIDVLVEIYRGLATGDPSANRSLAIYHLWRNKLGDREQAFAMLAREPEGPRRWNLEAVAHFQDGELVHALEKLEQAFAVDPYSEVTLFNRALVMSKLPLPEQQKKAWGVFLQKAGKSPWSSEARDRLEDSDRFAVPDSNAGGKRSGLVKRILELEDRESLGALLAEQEVTSLLESLKAEGDTFLTRGIEFRRALQGAEWDLLASKIGQLRKAVRDGVSGNDTREELRLHLETGDPISLVVALRGLAYLEIVAGNLEEARGWLHRILEACTRHGCREEAVLARSDLGTVEAERGDYRAAQRTFEEALQHLPEGSEFRRAEILNKKSHLSLRLGAPLEGLNHALEAARIHLRQGRFDGHAVALLNVSAALSRLELHRASIPIGAESVVSSRIATVVASEILARAHLGRAFYRLHEEEKGMEEVSRALELGEKSGWGSRTVSALSASSWLQGKVGRNDLAFEHASRASEAARRLGLPKAEASALHLAAEASEGMGSRDAAIPLLKRAISLNDSLAEGAPSRLAKVRIEASIATSRGLLSKLLMSSGEHHGAWEVLGDGPPRPLNQDECRVAYGKLGDESSVGVWIASPQGTVFEEGVESDSSFFSPWRKGRCPDDTRRLTVLENPFTLVGIGSPASRAERPEVPVVVTRSASLPWPEEKVEGPALVVHSPSPLIVEEPLPKLLGAKEEARLLLDVFPGSSELSGEAATPAGVAAVAAGHDLLHFGVHAESRLGAGAASYLHLAGEDGRLQVVDVLDLPLDKSKPVVVLFACQVGGEVATEEHDGAGLPWAFLEAGASAVIATSERLDDRAAVDFSRVFYRALNGGASSQEAFEEAVQALRSKWPPQVAASFVYYY